MHDLHTGFRSGSPARIARLVFVAAFAVRLGLNFALPDLYSIPPMKMERVAASFGATGELANPYMTPTGPTAHLLPLYPILLGTLYRLFGTGTEGQIAQHVWGCLLALRCGLIFPLALYLKADRTTAMIAA